MTLILHFADIVVFYNCTQCSFTVLSTACYTPACREVGNKRCFCPSVCLSVCLSVAYIVNNSRTQRTSGPKFGRKVPHLRCDSHTSFKVKRSKVRDRGGRGHTVSAEPCQHTAKTRTNTNKLAITCGE